MNDISKRKILWLIPLCMVIVVFGFCKLKNVDQMTDSHQLLEQLTCDGEFQYADLKWNISPKEAQKLLPYEIVKDDSRGDTGTIAFYQSQTMIEVDGQRATMNFEFLNEELKIVKYDFHLNETYEGWFEKKVEQLRRLYGEPQEVLDNETSSLACKGYKWETEKTTLQLILMAGENIRPSATLGVGSK